MKIACLGWGSLIWKPQRLPVVGEWQHDGPMLPIEFARVSDGGELATVICVNAAPVQVLWAWLDIEDVTVACDELRQREGIDEDRVDGVGLLIIDEMPEGELAEWAQERGIEAVVWTALPPKSAEMEGRAPTMTEAVAYLDSLTGETREHARDYVKRVPEQIDTVYRRAIVEALGWK